MPSQVYGVARSRTPTRSPDKMLAHVLHELALMQGSRGAGSSTVWAPRRWREQYIFFQREVTVLVEQGIAVVRPLVGLYATSMEITSASLSVMTLTASSKRS